MSYYGGWEPKDYITGDVPINNIYLNKKKHEYMDIRDWAIGKWKNEEQRDKELRKIYLSARIMKYHPLMTKALRKTYSLLAAAAMRAMSPEGKFHVKQEFSATNNAIKQLRLNQRAMRMKYGQHAKRGFYGKVDFWNALMDMPIDDAGVPAMVQGFNHGVLESNPDYHPSGILGTAENYDAYKDAMAEKREKLRQKRLLLTEGEKLALKRKNRLWSRGRATAREALKKYIKEVLANKLTAVDMAKYQPSSTLDSFYKTAFEDEIANNADFYGNLEEEDIESLVGEMMDELKEARLGNHKSWFKKFYRDNIKGVRFADKLPGRQRYTGLTLSNRAQPYRVVAAEGETPLRAIESAEFDPSRMLTANMRKANKTLADVQYWIPQNKAAYDAKVAQKKADAERAKAQAAADAEAALRAQYAELQKKFGPPPAPAPVSQQDTVLPSYESDDDEATEPPSQVTRVADSQGQGWGYGWY